MTQLRAKLKQLAKSYPVLNDHKVSSRVKRLERMADFYADKIPTAPKKQGILFSNFVSALAYAICVMKMHKNLTRHLAELAKEADQNERSSSKDLPE